MFSCQGHVSIIAPSPGLEDDLRWRFEMSDPAQDLPARSELQGKHGLEAEAVTWP